jgi:plasmid stabilization system protein ParE
MEYKIIVKTLAEQDITEAVDWYYTRAAHLTGKFLEEIDNSILILKKNPEHYQKRYNEVRILFLEKFPFGIYYTIENNVVFIHAVIHTKRDPKTGIERT